MSNGPRYRGKTFHEYMSAKFWHPASKRNIVTVWKRKQQMKVSHYNNTITVIYDIIDYDKIVIIVFRPKSVGTMSVLKKLGAKMKRIWYSPHSGTKNRSLVSLSYMICQIILCQEVRFQYKLHPRILYSTCVYIFVQI